MAKVKTLRMKIERGMGEMDFFYNLARNNGIFFDCVCQHHKFRIKCGIFMISRKDDQDWFFKGISHIDDDNRNLRDQQINTNERILNSLPDGGSTFKGYFNFINKTGYVDLPLKI